MNKRDYIKEIRQAEKEFKKILEQKDALEQKTKVKLSDIETNCLFSGNKYLRKR